MKKYYTKKDIASLTNCTIRTVNNKLNKGELKDYPIKYFGRGKLLIWANDFHAVLLYGYTWNKCNQSQKEDVREAISESRNE